MPEEPNSTSSETNLDVNTPTLLPHQIELNSDFLEDVPGRDNIMASVGALLYVSASPDILAGLSNKEFELIEKSTSLFDAFEKLGRVGLPERFRLPEGFTNHFKNEVIPDLRIIREDSAKRHEFRKELKEILRDPAKLSKLYRDGGTTYSDLATRVAGTKRQGKFYRPIDEVPGAESSVRLHVVKSQARFHYAKRHGKRGK